jgi:hypothetical protein
VEITGSERLTKALRAVIGQYNPHVVIETGTYLGTGSTRLIAEAFGQNPPEKFFTIEIARRHYQLARRNLADLKFVTVLWGLSVDREQAEQFLRNDPLLREARQYDIEVENPEDPVSFYLKELSDGEAGVAEQGDEAMAADVAPDSVLEYLLGEYRDRFPLIALDSAGGIGWLEFQLVMHVQQGLPFLLLLDDINHVKHYRSMLYVQSAPEFSIIDCDMKDGWLIAVFNPRQDGKV